MISLAKSATKANSGSQDASPEAEPAAARSATIEKLAAVSGGGEATQQQLFQAPLSPDQQQQPLCVPRGSEAAARDAVAGACGSRQAEASPCPEAPHSNSDAESVHK